MSATGPEEKIMPRWNRTLIYDGEKRKSELCKAKDWYTDWYKKWCAEIQETPRFHRKQWEFVYILRALEERACIGKGKRGLAFAVGTEPLPSVFAKYGCEILATDIQPERGRELGWDNGSQLCYGVEFLNTRNICDDAAFKERVSYRAVDMNDIPHDLRDFDFNWSSCSFEHLGSIEKGLRFLRNQLKTLKHGGWAVHTTEYNVASNDLTQDNDPSTVIFRQKDIDLVVDALRSEGHYVEEVDYSLGGLAEDYQVSLFPYEQDEVHLKLQINQFVATSVGLIIQKGTGRRTKKFSFFN